MREYLFRGKRVDNGEWVVGQLLHFTASVWTDEFTSIIQSCEWDNKNEWFNLGIRARVDFKTVGQYTGLTDKNGKKIFSGDVVKIYLYEPKGLANYEIGYIKCDDAKARYVFCTEEGIYGIDNSNVFEVIGNIHDNPELLSGGTK